MKQNHLKNYDADIIFNICLYFWALSFFWATVLCVCFCWAPHSAAPLWELSVQTSPLAWKRNVQHERLCCSHPGSLTLPAHSMSSRLSKAPCLKGGLYMSGAGAGAVCCIKAQALFEAAFPKSSQHFCNTGCGVVCPIYSSVPLWVTSGLLRIQRFHFTVHYTLSCTPHTFTDVHSFQNPPRCLEIRPTL